MKMICSKANECEACKDCYHSKVHEKRLPLCLRTMCVMVAKDFAMKNIDCEHCEYSKTCDQYAAKKQTSSDFKKRKEQAEKIGRDYEEPDERIVEIQQRLQNPVINLKKHGEDCEKYRKLLFGVSCKEVENVS
jgi:DNA repair ATPase RecN